MPRGDGTGPMGMGSLTGRRLGYCAGYDVPGFANPLGFGLGRGMAWGRGGGGGRGLAFRRGRGGFYSQYAQTPVPKAQFDDANALKSHISVLEEQLAAVKARLAEIENPAASDE